MVLVLVVSERQPRVADGTKSMMTRRRRVVALPFERGVAIGDTSLPPLHAASGRAAHGNRGSVRMLMLLPCRERENERADPASETLRKRKSNEEGEVNKKWKKKAPFSFSSFECCNFVAPPQLRWQRAPRRLQSFGDDASNSRRKKREPIESISSESWSGRRHRCGPPRPPRPTKRSRSRSLLTALPTTATASCSRSSPRSSP